MNKGTVIHLDQMYGLFTNGYRADWSPIRSEIIRLVTNKIERPRGGSPICFITSMITDRLDDTKLGYQLIIKITIFVISSAFFKMNRKKFRELFADNERQKPFKCAPGMARTVQLLTHGVLSYYTLLLVLKSGQLIANQI